MTKAGLNSRYSVWRHPWRHTGYTFSVPLNIFFRFWQNDDTALHIAAAMGRRKLTRMLLEAAADQTAKNKVKTKNFGRSNPICWFEKTLLREPWLYNFFCLWKRTANGRSWFREAGGSQPHLLSSLECHFLLLLKNAPLWVKFMKRDEKVGHNLASVNGLCRRPSWDIWRVRAFTKAILIEEFSMIPLKGSGLFYSSICSRFSLCICPYLCAFIHSWENIKDMKSNINFRS